MLFNIGGPPRTTINISHSVIDVAISFKPAVLASLLNCEISELPKKCQKFVEDNQDKFKDHFKPEGYMINLNNQIKKIEECTDVYLLILIFGSTVDDIYIPNRKLVFYSSNFTKTLYFSKAEVFNDE